MAGRLPSKPQEQLQNTRSSERPAPRTASRDFGQPIGERTADSQMDAKRSHGVTMEEAIVTSGRAGERNITIDWFWVKVEGHLPNGFNVSTLPDHGLDVVMEQRSYRKTYAGTGTLKTGLAPIAPIGTKGRLLVTDTTSGETFEQPWTWRPLGGGGSGLWQAIKRLLWKE
jgi:hypothetical protein